MASVYVNIIWESGLYKVPLKTLESRDKVTLKIEKKGGGKVNMSIKLSLTLEEINLEKSKCVSLLFKLFLKINHSLI